MNQQASKNILALDVGEVRTGVALKRSSDPLPVGLPIVNMQEGGVAGLKELINNNEINILVVGFPRNLNGNPTKQSEYVEGVIEALELPESIEICWQDESLTSVRAEEILKNSGSDYSKEDIDTIAASIILEDYLAERRF